MKVTSLNKNNYNNYFYKDKNIIPKNLKITNASRYSCDNTEIIEQYMTIIKKFIKVTNKTIITDTCSNIGASFINF